VRPGRLRIRVDFERSAGDDPKRNGGRVLLSADGGEPVALEVPRVNPTRYDLTGTGLRVGHDMNGVWNGLAPPAVFPGAIHRVRILKTDARRPGFATISGSISKSR
jgi:hypothetical protein